MAFFAENCLLQDSCKFHLDFLVEDRAGFPTEFTLSVSISTCNMFGLVFQISANLKLTNGRAVMSSLVSHKYLHFYVLISLFDSKYTK